MPFPLNHVAIQRHAVYIDFSTEFSRSLQLHILDIKYIKFLILFIKNVSFDSVIEVLDAEHT